MKQKNKSWLGWKSHRLMIAIPTKSNQEARPGPSRVSGQQVYLVHSCFPIQGSDPPAFHPEMSGGQLPVAGEDRGYSLPTAAD